MVARTGALRANRRYGFGYVPSYRPDPARPPPNRVRHPSSVNCASAPSRPRGRAPFSAASRLLEYTAGPPVSPVVVRDFAGSVASGGMRSGHSVRCSGPVARSVVGSAFGGANATTRRPSAASTRPRSSSTVGNPTHQRGGDGVRLVCPQRTLLAALRGALLGRLGGPVRWRRLRCPDPFAVPYAPASSPPRTGSSPRGGLVVAHFHVKVVSELQRMPSDFVPC